MMKEEIIGFICETGIGAIKDKLSETHDANEIRKKISEFAEREFELRFENADIYGELDFGGLQQYLNSELLDEIKNFLFNTDMEIQMRCKNTIMQKSFNYASANNRIKRDVVETFLTNILSMVKQYYVDKLDGQDVLLHNITKNDIIDTIQHENEKNMLYMKNMAEQLNRIEGKMNDESISKREFIGLIDGYFSKLTLRAYHVLYMECFENNPKLKTELNNILNMLVGLERFLDFCNTDFQKKYYDAVLVLTSAITPNVFIERFDSMPKLFQYNNDFVSLRYSYYIYSGSTINGDEVLEFSVSKGMNILLFNYLTFVVKDSKVIYDFFCNQKTLLEKEYLLLDLYIRCVEENISKDEALKELSSYNDIYGATTAFKVLQFELYSDSVRIEEIIESIHNNGIHLHSLLSLFNKLHEKNRIDDAVLVYRELSQSSFEVKIKYLAILLSNKTTDNMLEADKIVDLLIADGYDCYEVYAIKADISLFRGFQLDCLKHLEKAYHSNDDVLKKQNLLLNILSLRYNNSKCKEDDLLFDAAGYDNVQLQLFVALSYNKTGNESKYLFHIKKSVLMSKGYNEHIYSIYATNILNNSNESKEVNVDRIGINTAVHLKDIDTGLVIALCIHDSSIDISGKEINTANASHFLSTEKSIAGLLRRKKGEIVSFSDVNYEVINIMDVDTFLFQYCCSELIQNGIVKQLEINMENPDAFIGRIQETINASKSENDRIIRMYSNPVLDTPISLNMISIALSRNYLETFFHLLYNEKIVFWNNPFGVLLDRKQKIVLTLNAISLLKLLDIDMSILSGFENLHVAASTKNKFRDNQDDNYRYMNREMVMSLFSHEGGVGRLVYDEEQKRKSIEFFAEINELLDSLKLVENEQDLAISEIISAEVKHSIGVCDYDSIALFNEKDAVVVTDDFLIARLIKSSPEIQTNTCGIVDFLVYLDLGVERLLNCILKLKGFKFHHCLTFNVINYISSILSKTDDEELYIKYMGKIDELLDLAEDKSYKVIFIENIRIIMQHFASNKLPINKGLWMKLFAVLRKDFIEKHKVVITTDKDGKLTVGFDEIERDTEALVNSEATLSQGINSDEEAQPCSQN